DFFANALISEVNRVHASGQAQIPSSRYEGSVRVFLPDENLNFADVGLPNRVENGSFMVHVTHEATGQRVAQRVDVNGNATSLNQLVSEINTAMGGGNAAATISADGRLILEAAAGYALSFSDDTSGALAALGINTFFVGDSAANIDVSEEIRASPGRLAVARDHVPGSNGTALAMAKLQDEPIDSLGGLSLRGHWQDQVNQLAVRTSQAGTDVETTSLVRESLDAQFQAVSGVSVDEETISMLTYQRQFQAASRFIATIDEAMQELLRLA
ncbi:MAG: flagellar basal body rod C-terminal domain-containing protein, partial [Planctomycetota bacterium]